MVNVPNCEYVFLVSGTNIWHHYIFISDWGQWPHKTIEHKNSLFHSFLNLREQVWNRPAGYTHTHVCVWRIKNIVSNWKFCFPFQMVTLNAASSWQTTSMFIHTQHQDVYPQINHLAHTLITSSKMDTALMLNLLTITGVNSNISDKNNQLKTFCNCDEDIRKENKS